MNTYFYEYIEIIIFFDKKMSIKNIIYEWFDDRLVSSCYYNNGN